jgi:ParB-like chromosome segregation protein Spo0J
MPLLHLHPLHVEPLHEVQSLAKVAELGADMRENGWNDRPILVVKTTLGYQAWTGSHRIEAAREAGLRSIPCYVIPESSIEPYGVDAAFGHVEDRERLEVLRKVGDAEAIRLMWLEGRH